MANADTIIEMSLSRIEANERRKRRLLRYEPDESNGLLHGREHRNHGLDDVEGMGIIGILLLILILLGIAAPVKYLFFGKPKPAKPERPV
jgi:hypothetical protein